MRKVYDMIRGLTDPSIDRALASALHTATPETAEPIVEALLERNRMPDALALVEQFHRLSSRSQERIVEQGADLAVPLRRAAAKGRSPAASQAVAIIDRGSLWSLAHLLADVVRRGDAGRKREAAQVLLAMAERIVHASSIDAGPKIVPDAMRHMRAAVSDAVIHFGQHERRDVLAAGLFLLDQPLPGLRQALADPEHPAVEPLGAILAQAQRWSARRALLPALGYPTLAEQAIRGLAAAIETGKAGDAFVSGASLRRPGIRTVIQAAPRPDRLWPAAEQAAGYGPEAQRALPEFAGLVTRDINLLSQRLTSLAALTDESARLDALRRLSRIRLEGAYVETHHRRIAVFTTDASPAIARMALRQLIRRDPPDLIRTLTTLCNSPHPSVAELAERTLAPIGFDRLWTIWPRLSIDQRLALGRAMIKIDERFHNQIRAKLITPQQPAVLRALAMILDLGQAAFFENDLIRLTTRTHPRVAATAVRVLGQIKTEAADRVINLALEHADARVRANAVEALEARVGPPVDAQVDRLSVIARDEANRPRANAIRSLLRLAGRPEERAASEELGRMLHDRRPEHRRSALWVIESAALVNHAAEVAEMAVADEDHRVQARARQTFERMLGLLTPQGLAALPGSPEDGLIARIRREDSAPPTESQGAA